MHIRRQAKALLAEHLRGVHRIAATSPGEAPQLEQALAGDLQHNAGQTNLQRQIPEDYKYDPKALKPLAKMLWGMSVSLGHALSAHKEFVKLKSATISPDGMIGGRGYVMAVKDVRTMLHDACEALSALCDTIHDEINGPHWEPKLGMLEKQDVDQIQSLMGEAQRYLDDPEGESDEDEEEAEKSGHAGWHHPAVDKENKRKKEPGSQMPSGGDKETGPQAQPLRHDMRKSPSQEKQASTNPDWYDTGFTLIGTFKYGAGVKLANGQLVPDPAPLVYTRGERPDLVARVAARFLQSNSSLPTQTLPGGPRVQHLDRADTDQKGPFGELNDPEPEPPKDEWGTEGGVSGTPMSDNTGEGYNFPSDWEGNLHDRQGGGADMALGHAFFSPDADLETELPKFMAALFGQVGGGKSGQPVGTSALPDSNSDKTPTEGFDFGIGDGNGDEARGQGAGGYGEGNPAGPDTNPGGGVGNRGVYGPQSGIPKDPGGKVNPDEGDSNLTIENEIGGKGRYAGQDPWVSHPSAPGTVPFTTNDFKEVTEDPQSREANADKPWGQDSDGWVMGLDPETLIALGSTKQGWYDGVYDFERPVEPVGSAPLPGGPQEPYVGGGELPGDGDLGVARTDYYDGWKPDNMQNTGPSNVGATKLPGEQMPAKLTPTTQRPSHNQEFMFGTGELPGDGERVDYDYNLDLGPNQTTRFEQQNTPYIKWDDNTPEMRPDPVHQRDPVQGPYVHNDLTERPSNG